MVLASGAMKTRARSSDDYRCSHDSIAAALVKLLMGDGQLSDSDVHAVTRGPVVQCARMSVGCA